MCKLPCARPARITAKYRIAAGIPKNTFNETKNDIGSSEFNKNFNRYARFFGETRAAGIGFRKVCTLFPGKSTNPLRSAELSMLPDRDQAGS